MALVTTIFFSEDRDAVLDCVPVDLRSRLLPRREPSLDADGAWAYRWDVILAAMLKRRSSWINRYLSRTAGPGD